MIRRPLRPHFGFEDEKRLIEALREARDWIIKCGSGAAFRSPRREKCDAVTSSIDDLAGELTGDPTLFHDKGSGGTR